MRNKIKRIIAIFITLVGIAFLVYPYFINKITSKQIEKSINDFLEETSEIENDKVETQNSKKVENNEKVANDILDYMYVKMQRYNRNLNENGQNIVDAFSYETPSFDLTQYGLKENIIGIILIPKINLELPIYLGATKENLSKGAAHLSQTSIPLGENDSNTVIAAHRSIVRNSFFRNIDKLEIGDEVIIKTFWHTLTYTVNKKEVISPYDSSKILIQKNRDLVTLITCHPYGQTSERYVVFCERK